MADDDYEAFDVFQERPPRYDRSLAAFAAKRISVLDLHQKPGHHFFVVRHNGGEDIAAMAVAREIDDGVHLDTLIVTDPQHRLRAYMEICDLLFSMGYFRFVRRPDDDEDYRMLTGGVLGFETVGQAPDWTVELRVKTW